MTLPFSKYFDHTLLKPDATFKEIHNLCEEATHYDFYSVCVNGYHVMTARHVLLSLGAFCGIEESANLGAGHSTGPASVKITAVVGFPLGTTLSNVKAFEADKACSLGASEIDMVINIGVIKDAYIHDVAGDLDGRDVILSIVVGEVDRVKRICENHGATLKVILETGAYTGLSTAGTPLPFTKESEQQLRLACQAALAGGADFLKTSTGFGYGGATTAALTIMKEEALKYATTLGTTFKFKSQLDAMATPNSKSRSLTKKEDQDNTNILTGTNAPAKLKASGGIRDLATARAMIAAGADRLGTSATVAIMEEYLARG